MHYPMRPTSGGGFDQLDEQVKDNPKSIATDKINGDRAFVIVSPDGEVIVLNRHLRSYTKRHWFEEALKLLPIGDEQIIYDCEMMAKTPKYRGSIAVLDIVSEESLTDRLLRIAEFAGDMGNIGHNGLFMPEWSYTEDLNTKMVWNWQQEFNKEVSETLFEGLIIKDDAPYEKNTSRNGSTVAWLKYKHTN